MAEVDPDDDAIRRYIVLHYRFDPGRRERRQVVVATFDNEREFVARIDELAAQLDEKRGSGAVMDEREHITGVVHEAGHQARQRIRHLIRRVTEHGVVPGTVDDLPRPPDITPDHGPEPT